MPFKRGKSHVITLTQAYVSAFLSVKAFRKNLFALADELIINNAFYSDSGPFGPWKQVVDRVSLGTFAAQFLDAPEDHSFVIWTSRTIGVDATKWSFSFYADFLEHMDDLALNQSKKRRRGAFVFRTGGKLDVAEATPIRLRIPHK